MNDFLVVPEDYFDFEDESNEELSSSSIEQLEEHDQHDQQSTHRTKTRMKINKFFIRRKLFKRYQFYCCWRLKL
jgi:hypothetical protein